MRTSLLLPASLAALLAASATAARSAAEPPAGSSGTAGGATAPADLISELLPRLAKSEARLRTLYHQGSFVVRSTIREKSGRDSSVSEVETRMFVKDGEPWERITRYIDDGEDVTAERDAKRQKELASGERERKDGLPFTSPFAADQQRRYAFEDLGPEPGVPGLRRIAFESKKRSEKLYVGEALIDVERGAVLELKFRPSDYPRFVKKLDVTMTMGAETPVGPALSSLKVSASGSFLFIRKKVRIETTFTDYVPSS